MQRAGTTDMALWGGRIPPWLFERMVLLARPVVESILLHYGREHFLSRLADPYWFQSFGAVIGMDWNSSGVTTAVHRALKRALNPASHELGIYVCGGKGKHSRATPTELLAVGDKTGLDGDYFARCSKLTAKVDNTAVQDGYQLYLHGFYLSAEGEWTVVQQGMEGAQGLARRYHWHSAGVQSFVEEPHAAVCGENQGPILNLTATEAAPTQVGILKLSQEKPAKLLAEIPRMQLPDYCDLRARDVDLKRLGSVLWLAQETETTDFSELLLLKGLGPRTLQALTLVSEVIHGTPSRFHDPARFAFAHGGKSAKPFAVPTKVYDETIHTLQEAVEKARIGALEKDKAISKLHELARRAEADFTVADRPDFAGLLEKERQESLAKYGGRTVNRPEDGQLSLF
ncbi:MAG: DUF763 domain-containing protein [Bacteroidota bacterium]